MAVLCHTHMSSTDGASLPNESQLVVSAITGWVEECSLVSHTNCEVLVSKSVRERLSLIKMLFFLLDNWPSLILPEATCALKPWLCCVILL